MPHSQRKLVFSPTSQMGRKSRPRVSKPDLSKDLWINPNSNLRGPDGNRAWNQGNINPKSGARFLELAAIALGLKKPEPKKKKAAAAVAGAHHIGSKTEPYSD